MAPPSFYAHSARSSSASPSNSSSNASPFPPVANTSRSTPSPYAPTTALISTPYSHQSRSRVTENETRSTIRGQEKTRSESGDVGSSTNRSKWNTPGQLSRSFEGDEIAAQSDDMPSLPGPEELDGGLGEERSIRLNDSMVSIPMAKLIAGHYRNQSFRDSTYYPSAVQWARPSRPSTQTIPVDSV
jgi:hypothetical protein